MSRQATCHPEKNNFGRGLCSTCYLRQWNAWQKSRGDGYRDRRSRALRETLAEERYQIALHKYLAQRPAVTKRRDEIRRCPHCGATILRDDGPFLACLCGARIPLTDGDWERERGRLAMSHPAPLLDGMAERQENLSFRVRPHRRGIGKALTVTSHRSANVKTG